MLLHGALTGDMPSRDMSIMQTVHYHLAVTPTPLTQRAVQDKDGMSAAQVKAAAFQRLLDAMVAKLPERRFRTCNDILLSVDAYAAADDLQSYQPRLSSVGADLLQVLASSNKLHGRTFETNQLHVFHRRVYQAERGGLAVVQGPSGGTADSFSPVCCHITNGML